jgi:hemerythrin-like metal-binding protein
MKRENRTYDEICVGDEATVKRSLTADDLYIFAQASRNLNPVHLPEAGHEASRAIVAPSMWIGSLISSALGNILPGAGTLYKSQTLKFLGRVHVGDELIVKVRVREKLPGNQVALDTTVARRDGALIAEGVAEVLAPLEKITHDDEEVPEVSVTPPHRFSSLVEWSDEFSVGVEEIDNEHKTLLKLLNGLHRAVEAGGGQEALGKVLEGLIRYVSYHFSHEEEMFVRTKYPGYIRHRQQHQALTTTVAEIYTEFQSGADATLPKQVLEFLKNWLYDHILESDRAFGNYFNRKRTAA